MEEKHTGAKWCNAYGCWCSDVYDITDNQVSCYLEGYCNDCDDLEYIRKEY